jgi:hypothetical protein
MHTSIIAIILCVGGADASASHARRGELVVTGPGHATLTFVLHSASSEPSELVEPIELPVGMTATALHVSIDGVELRSTSLASGDARASYDDVVRRLKDPALLEYRSEGVAILRVFPIRRDTPATVVVELTARSLAEAAVLVHLDSHVSLFAMPRVAPEAVADLYADYWPSHER